MVPVELTQDEETRRALRHARREPDDVPAEVALLLAALVLLGACVRLIVG